jgi:hypothetical protein
MTTSLFVIANLKQFRNFELRYVVRILLPFFRTSWSAGVLNSAILISFHNRFWRVFGISGGGVQTPAPSVRHWRTVILSVFIPKHYPVTRWVTVCAAHLSRQNIKGSSSHRKVIIAVFGLRFWTRSKAVAYCKHLATKDVSPIWD